MLEKFGIEVAVGEYFGESIYHYNHGPIKLLAYQTHWERGDIVPKDHEEFQWVKPNQLDLFDFAQNKTLAQLPLNEEDDYLFEVFEEGEYTFMGRVELAGEPYQEGQPDKFFKERKVWIFPLKAFQDEEMPIIPESVILKKQEQKEKQRNLFI